MPARWVRVFQEFPFETDSAFLAVAFSFLQDVIQLPLHPWVAEAASTQDHVEILIGFSSSVLSMSSAVSKALAAACRNCTGVIGTMMWG